jgi:hypothetical protein
MGRQKKAAGTGSRKLKLTKQTVKDLGSKPGVKGGALVAYTPPTMYTPPTLKVGQSTSGVYRKTEARG